MLLLSLPEMPRSVSVWSRLARARGGSAATRRPGSRSTAATACEAPLFTDRPASCVDRARHEIRRGGVVRAAAHRDVRLVRQVVVAVERLLRVLRSRRTCVGVSVIPKSVFASATAWSNVKQRMS